MARYSDHEISEELLHNDARLQKRVKWFYKSNRKEIKAYVLKHGGTSRQASQVLQDGMLALFHTLKTDSQNKGSLSQLYVGICKAIWDKSAGHEIYSHPHLHEEKAMEKLFARMDDSDVQVLKAFYFEAKTDEQISKQFGRPAPQLESDKKWNALRQLKDLLLKDEDLLEELYANIDSH